MIVPKPKVSVPVELIANYYSPALIVDNDELVQKILPSQLHQFGFRSIESAFDGEQARACLASRSQIGLTILDLSMPRLDGIAIIKDIAYFHPACAIIILSSLDENLLRTVRLLAESYGLKVLAAREKPLKKQDLLELLSEGFCSSRIDVRHDQVPGGKFRPTKMTILNSLPNLVLHFQPKISLRTGETVGCEALARLVFEGEQETHILTPDHFIPHFENAGRMTELTTLVVKQALDGLLFFKANGIDINMSINLSMHDLELPSFPGFIEREIKNRSISPEQVTLEITETSLSKNMKACMETASRLRLLGCSVSIDDFGTGFSSLKQLRQLPFNELKIDESFVGDALDDTGAHAIVESCIGIAEAFGLKVVAEGIETEAERNLVLGLGCEVGQGFLFCEAKPKEHFIDWMSHSVKM